MTGPDITPEEAREQLERASRAGVVTRRDRNVHGWDVILYGMAVGGYVTLAEFFDVGGSLLVLLCFAGVCIAMTVWKDRTSRAVPRRANRNFLVATAAMIVLSFIVFTTFNFIETESVLKGWHIFAGGFLIALPCIVAGIMVIRGDRR